MSPTDSPAVRTIMQMFPPKPTFHASDIQDLSGHVFIVTGGAAGVGKETVKVLAEHNATVYMAARSRDKAMSAIAEIKAQTGKDAIFLEMDLASLKSIKAAVEGFTSKETRLDVLINNAGVIHPPIEQLTIDGYDMTIGTNLVGPFYLTSLLLPLLAATARSGRKSRVINVTSALHMQASHDVIKCAKNTPERKKAGGPELYNVSKFGLVLYTNELARRYINQGIVSLSLHPGVVKTEFSDKVPGLRGSVSRAFISLGGSDVQHGALTQLYAATTPDIEQLNGKYLIPWARIGQADARTEYKEAARTLYQWLEKEVQNV